MDHIRPVRVRPHTAVTVRPLLGGGRSQGRPGRAAAQWPNGSQRVAATAAGHTARWGVLPGECSPLD
jgi:hypothetical protein